MNRQPVKLCAWCIKGVRNDAGHGICPRHAKKLLEDCRGYSTQSVERRMGRNQG